jgi:hypothetical protein
MSIIDGYIPPWQSEGLSRFDWGVKQRQKIAAERFARGGTDEVKFGESQQLYWQKRCFVEAVFERARAFLQLKEHNSVSILFEICLKGDLADSFPIPSPALLRVRIVRTKQQGTGPRCQWRAADAVGEQSSVNDSLDAISSCFSGSGFNRISGFLESHYGVSLPPYISHYPDVLRIQARMVFGEPLGALAVIQGDSLKVTYNARTHAIDARNCLVYLKDDSLLAAV